MAEKSPAGPINADRGEFALVLEGERFGLRPSYSALAEAEEATGMGLILLAREALAGSLTRDQLARIATIFMREWGRAAQNANAAGANADKVGRMIMDSPGGMAEAMTITGTLLSLAVTGGLTSEGEVKPAATNPTTA